MDNNDEKFINELVDDIKRDKNYNVCTYFIIFVKILKIII